MNKNENMENDGIYAGKEEELKRKQEGEKADKIGYIRDYISNKNVKEEKKEYLRVEEVLQEIGNGYEGMKDKRKGYEDLKRRKSEQNEIKTDIEVEEDKQIERKNSISQKESEEYLEDEEGKEELKEGMEEKDSNKQKNPFRWLRSASSGSIISSLTRSPFQGNAGIPIISPQIRSKSQTSCIIEEGSQQPISIKKPDKTSTEKLREEFEKIYQQVPNDETIDWDFFRLMISDYSFVVKKHKEELSNVISSGVPPILRGIIWQTMTSSKNTDMEYIYHTLINQNAPNEKIIRRDLHRTFPKPILRAMEQYSYNI
ncbi:hypothetical protein T552_01898 [Pneumocystis carinii B80]|uniref:Rab-GAP TBC domain-containing protein n=1 Tax=Pneumocystis carinii (strain B80) TaxID=1408658 RepID=A0A0W4ZI57_PNEC8|nr:hypothetical protein T552_01898 [Pneumocystis carinii B80]KTW28036.1 hypothetical protein T552_01898 [Pneumocystis carinii B80]